MNAGGENAEVQSPDILGGTPRRGAGVRRLNRMPLVFAFLIVCVILGAVTYTYQMRLADQRRRAAEAEPSPEPASVHEVFRDAPDGGLIPAETLPEPKKEEAPVLPAPDPEEEERRQRWSQRQQAREQAALQALAAPTTVSHGLDSLGRSPGRASERGERAASARLQAAGARRRRPGFRDNEAADINGAEAKRRFLTDGAAPKSRLAHYLPAGREAPLSPY
jgi:type IV secretory pathway VirB10-like protein